jgi:hypothetical protein
MKTIAGGLAAIALTIGLAACGDSAYPKDAQHAFMGACTAQDGATRGACQCTFDKVQSKVSYKDFKRADVAARAGLDMPEKVQNALLDAVADCS